MFRRSTSGADPMLLYSFCSIYGWLLSRIGWATGGLGLPMLSWPSHPPTGADQAGQKSLINVKMS